MQINEVKVKVANVRMLKYAGNPEGSQLKVSPKADKPLAKRMIMAGIDANMQQETMIIDTINHVKNRSPKWRIPVI